MASCGIRATSMPRHSLSVLAALLLLGDPTRELCANKTAAVALLGPSAMSIILRRRKSFRNR